MALKVISSLASAAGPIGLGTWALGGGSDWGNTPADVAQQTLQTALEEGITWIDTAPIYGAGMAEEQIGRFIKLHRHQITVATKCGICLHEGRPDHDLRPTSIVAECEVSLRRLQTDYIDVYQIHWPDPKVPLADSLGALMRLQEQGKIRAMGVCNFSLEQLAEACALAPIVSVQGPLSLLCPQGLQIAHWCHTHGLSFWAYGGLGGGILSGKYKQMPNFRRADARRYFYKYYWGEDFERATLVAGRVKQLAEQKNLPPSAVALAWVLQQPGVSGVLAGARTPAQVKENKRAAEVVLTETEQAFLYGKHHTN